MIQKLNDYGFIDETHGILSIQEIANICKKAFKDYNIEYCYLFGSYAKGKANETSDVDLLVSTPISGIEFFDLVENIRENLKKMLMF